MATISESAELVCQQGFELAEFFFGQALVATKDQLAQVLAFMAQAVTHRMVATMAELQAQIAGLMAVLQGVQGHQALDLTEEHPEDALRLQAGLQLQAQLLAKLGKGGGATWYERWLTKPQALQFGSIEVNCVGLGGCFHKRSASKHLAVLQAQ
jgi:hypothetical protein